MNINNNKLNYFLFYIVDFLKITYKKKNFLVEMQNENNNLSILDILLFSIILYI